MRKYASKLLPSCLSAALLLVACSSSSRHEAGTTAGQVDFSGSWEVDFSQSESVRDVYTRTVHQLQRDLERRSRGQPEQQAMLAAGAISGEGLYTLARMAEVVTEPQLLDIRQDANEITVKREGSFALQCDFRSDLERTSAFGRETCEWRDHQLFFRVELPDGLIIVHRFILAPDGRRLQMATTLFSKQASQPFTVARVFNRYDPTRSGFTCRQTLTRERVCTTESPEQ